MDQQKDERGPDEVVKGDGGKGQADRPLKAFDGEECAEGDLGTASSAGTTQAGKGSDWGQQRCDTHLVDPIADTLLFLTSEVLLHPLDRFHRLVHVLHRQSALCSDLADASLLHLGVEVVCVAVGEDGLDALDERSHEFPFAASVGVHHLGPAASASPVRQIGLDLVARAGCRFSEHGLLLSGRVWIREVIKKPVSQVRD